MSYCIMLTQLESHEPERKSCHSSAVVVHQRLWRVKISKTSQQSQTRLHVAQAPTRLRRWQSARPQPRTCSASTAPPPRPTGVSCRACKPVCVTCFTKL